MYFLLQMVLLGGASRKLNRVWQSVRRIDGESHGDWLFRRFGVRLRSVPDCLAVLAAQQQDAPTDRGASPLFDLSLVPGRE